MQARTIRGKAADGGWMRRGRRVVLGLLVGLGPATARADGRAGESFAVRLPAALSRFSPYGDVAAVGGSSAGSKWISSINPAATDWQDSESPLGMSVDPQYTQICFDNDTKLHVFAGTWVMDLGERGTLTPTYAHAESNTARTRQGTDFGFSLDQVQLQWGKRLNDTWALGAGGWYADSDTDFGLGGMDLVAAESETYGLRVGGLCQPVDKWLAGLVVEYSYAESVATTYDLFGLGFGRLRERSHGQQAIVHPGVSYEYAQDSLAFCDYQVGFFADGGDDLTLQRWSAGVDHRIVDWLFVRGGAMVDDEGEMSWGTGFGFYPNDWLTVDVAYQLNFYPELEPELGESQSLTVSVGILL